MKTWMQLLWHEGWCFYYGVALRHMMKTNPAHPDIKDIVFERQPHLDYVEGFWRQRALDQMGG